MTMRSLSFIGLLAILAGSCTAKLVDTNRHVVRKKFSLIQHDEAKNKKAADTPRRVQQGNHSNNNNNNNNFGPVQSDSVNCEQAAAYGSSTNNTCSCTTFADGVQELSCAENCLYCGDSEPSSCGQFSFATNWTTDGMASSYATRFQYDGTSGRSELISVEEIDCNDIGECTSCRVLVNGTQCNSCTLCPEGAIVDCENVAEGSSFSSCTSEPGPGLFEGFAYDVVECVVPPPPLNDNCTSAVPIAPGDVVLGELTGALEDNVPWCPTGEAGTHGVWYSFEGTGTTVLVSTCSESNTTFGSGGLITVYQGSACDLLECIVGSTQLSYCTGSGGSSVVLPTAVDTTYFVYVSGWSGSFGTFDLSLTSYPEQNNDQCGTASVITVDGSPVVGTIEFGQAGRFAACTSERVEKYGGAWYSFAAPQDATLRASTCGSSTIGWTSSIAITSGVCDDLACVEQSEPYSYYQTCNEGGTFVDFQVVAGTIYQVALWGSGYGDVGLFELDIRSLNPPENDNCENAQAVDVNANFTAAFIDATLSSDEAGDVCFEQMGSSNSGGTWYTFAGTGDIVVATACSNDISIYVSIHSGTCGALLCSSPVTWNTPRRCFSYLYGTQSMPMATEEGKTYFVLVSGSGPTSGSLDFSLRSVPPVANDKCIDAIEIEADGQVIIGNTEGAIYEDFNDSCQYSSRSPGVWYVVIGNGGMLRADTCSPVTNFDTVISVYRGSCEDLQCVGANDDGCQSLSSSILWDAVQNETYYILVSGLGDGQTGDYGFKVAPFVPAVNDACDGAINLTIGGQLAGTMEGASSNNESYACYRGYDRPTLWYYIDGTGTALKVSTCSPSTTFYGGIQAFEGTTCADLECVGLTYEGGGYSDYECPYTSTATWFFAEEGLRYYILLIDDSSGGANSTFTLNVTEFQLAANDVCEMALPIALTGNATVEGSTANSLPDNVTCDYYSSNAPGVWYSVVGTGNALMASTCSSTLTFDSSIYIFAGGCGDLECVALGQSGYSSCGDSSYGGSRASFRTEVGVQYYILVTGAYSSAVGGFGLSLAEIIPPPNDVCSDAIEVSPNSGIIVGSLSNATSFFGSNYSCAYDPSALNVWYSVIGTGDVIAISTCSSQLNFDSAISVSTGSCDDHVCLSSNAYNSGACPETSFSAARITIRSEIGVVYFIAVEGLNFPSQGDFGLTISTLQVPANDECPGAIPIQPDAGTISGSIANATGYYNYNISSCSYSDGPDVWYSMSGTGEVYAVSTCSSALNFDTSLSIAKGSCDLQECVAYSTYGNSECTDSFYTASRAVFRTEVGVEYFIVVQGVNYPSKGEFTLEFSTVETPANDDCSGAIVIQPGNKTIVGALTNATGTVGFNASCEYSSGTPGVWFTMIGTGEVYSISTCSRELTFDAALSVSTGSCDNQTCITSGAYNDYDCAEASYAAAKVLFRTEVGEEYHIQVQSLSSSSEGEFTLHLSTVLAPVNDVCPDAISIPPGTESVSGSITNATATTGATNTCSFSYSAPDVWYKLIGTGDVYTVSTCSSVLDFESGLSVSTGSCSNQECIVSSAYNDETCQSGSYLAARVVFGTEVGVEYFISVQGVNFPVEGDFELQIKTTEAPPNDVCNGAVTVVPGDEPIFGSTSLATNSVTNSSCSGSDTSPDLWYRVEGTGTTLTASTCGGRTTYDSQLSIYEGVGDECDRSCIATNDDSCGSGSKVEWTAEEGVTYYIRVHGFSTSSGSFVLRVT